MKALIPLSLMVVAVLAGGCASQPHGLVLDPIGPPGSPPASAGPDGTLVVFSAFDAHADFNDSPYVRHYTDYKITRPDGQFLETVHNDTAPMLQSPRRVQLSPGAYRVVARANGYGVVTVPVIIRAGQVTMVHLEGGPRWQQRAQLAGSDPVRLPDGEIAGWRAAPDNPAKP